MVGTYGGVGRHASGGPAHYGPTNGRFHRGRGGRSGRGGRGGGSHLLELRTHSRGQVYVAGAANCTIAGSEICT